ncbi:MAG: ATP-binding protein [Marinifilaceae bacterium]
MGNYLKEELYELIKKDDSIFSFLQNSSLDGLWYWDLEQPENEWMNKRFWTTLGYNPEEMPHKASAWQDIINQEDLQVALDNFKKHLENPDHPYDQIVRYTHKNGSIVWIRCRGMAIRDKDGKPIRMLGAHHDITEQKKTEQALKELNATKDKLFSIISHDLRSPFNSIVGFSDLLLENLEAYDCCKIKETVGYINQAGERTLCLLNNLLAWSNLHTGQICYKSENINLESIFQEVIACYLPSARIKNISIDHHLEAEIELYFDPNILKIVLRNLISNAIKFTNSGGKIEVSATGNPNQIEVSVSDNGVGMDEVTRNKLFKIDTNVTTLGTAKEKGSGLGLVLCKDFIELHGGSIWVESELNKGSKFKFSLPYVKE